MAVLLFFVSLSMMVRQWLSRFREMVLLVCCISLSLGGCECNDAGESGWMLEDEFDGSIQSAPDAVGADVEPADAGAPTPEYCQGAGPECLANCGRQLPGPSQMSLGRGPIYAARLALDATGCPHVASFQEGDDGSEFEIKYARWDGEEWVADVLATTTAYNWLVDLVVDDQGLPSIVYVTDDHREVHYVRRDEFGSWSSRTIGRFPRLDSIRLQLAPSGRPVLAGVSQGSENYLFRLVYLERGDDGVWVEQEALAAKPLMTHRGRISFDANGQPHMVVTSGSSDNSIYYVHRVEPPDSAGSEWVVEVIDQESSVMQAGVALDQAGRPHIVSCHWSAAPAVIHHWRTASRWQIEEVVADADSLWACGAMAFDGSGQLHMLYGAEPEANPDFLRHGVWDGDSWAFESLGPFVRGDVELVIDPRFNIVQGLARVPSADDSLLGTARYFHFEHD